MDTEQIDILLNRYDGAVARIAANLVELDDHPTYALVTSGALTGVTGARAKTAALNSPKLWVGLDALRQTLDRATAIRESGRLSGSERLELEAILTRDSVLLGTTDTPLAERDLLQQPSVDQHVSIENLLGLLRQYYTPLRELIAEIDAVWRDVLPRLDAAETTVHGLEQDLEALAVAEPAVTQARSLISDARQAIMDDPLSLAPETGDNLDAAVAEAAHQVGLLRHAQQNLDADLAQTDVLLADARVLRSRAATAYSEAQIKILEPVGLKRVPGEAAIEELARRAETLRAPTEQSWQELRAELDSWLGLAQRLVNQLATAAEANVAPLAERDQLRGLLTAYRVKGASVGLIENENLGELVDAAHNELFTSPTNLSRARTLLGDIGRAIAKGTT